jgi:uncharacterized protein (TIGR03437 family)
VPAGTASGAAQVTVTSDAGAQVVGSVEVLAAAPGLFSADGSGSGAPSAWFFRLHADGTIAIEPASQPVDLGAASGDRVWLCLLGTGIRGANDASLTLGEVATPLDYAGPQASAGVDQVNVLLPASLAGRGSIDVQIAAGGERANAVQIAVK